ncbi:MAG: cupin domain-containing protein [Parahaliea sp.]
MVSEQWRVFDLEDIKQKLAGGKVEYLEFLNVSAMSCGLYFLPAGSKDMQSHHDDDEIYLVLEGKARMRLGDRERAVSAGSVLYVGATTEHSFFEIDEDMTLLVMLASTPPAKK